MSRFGMVRASAAVPQVRPGDTRFNAARTIDMMHSAAQSAVDVLVFPEMGLTGYTCQDLFFQKRLLEAAGEALQGVVAASARIFGGMVIVGLPLVVDDQIFNCAAVIVGGEVLGFVPKTYLPNYKEFYDARFFAPAHSAVSTHVRFGGRNVPFGTDLLFPAGNLEGLTVGVEICEDLWCPIPPSSLQAVHGATLLLNLSASNETIAKAAYRRSLVTQQSARCVAGYVYASAGPGESTTDIVFGGHAIIAENGSLAVESKLLRFDDHGVHADIDVERIAFDRRQTTSFADAVIDPGLRRSFRRVEFSLPSRPADLTPARFIDPRPFVPSDPHRLRERCEEIFAIQTTALGRRLQHVGGPAVAIGVSGGLDSTLALLVLCKTLDRIGQPRSRIKALTMPGFGTTNRTLTNAKLLMDALGVAYREIDIRPMCFEEMRSLGHCPFGYPLDGLTLDGLIERLRDLPPDRRHDLTFENTQARARTSLLMNTGFVIGTGDLSEAALGWCTYNADHMSMYNPNASIPKTLVKFLVQWAAENEFDGSARTTLLDIVSTDISPELLPTTRDGKAQSTESTVGPYELHDFFLYHFLRFGMTPDKILFLASHAKFSLDYPSTEIRRYLRLFIQRFFTNQFKRSCLPDGPKVGSVSLSPRGDWRMPSDAVPTIWLDEIK